VYETEIAESSSSSSSSSRRRRRRRRRSTIGSEGSVVLAVLMATVN